MEQRIGFDERELLNDRLRLSEEFEKSMNVALANYVADLLAIRGAGDYQIVIFLERNLSSDRSIYHLAARDRDGARVNFPRTPDWDSLPDNVNWWTVSAVGQVVWHELEPTVLLEQGCWVSAGRMYVRPALEIPLGIDWRTLRLERPTNTIARHKAMAAPAPAQENSPLAKRWGILRTFGRLLP